MKLRLLSAIALLSFCGSMYAQESINGWRFESWQKSFTAGHNDKLGNYLGGSQMMHLVPHKGKLYAAVSYWMDKGCVWYGHGRSKGRWAQILRLDGPTTGWEQDFMFPKTGLRPEILKELTFTTDGKGKRLRKPVSFLITCNSFVIGPNKVGLKCFARDDKTGKWHDSFIMTGSGFPGEGYSIRDMHVHRDKVTRTDMVFTTIGTSGIFSGVYDPKAPGWIKWNKTPEPTQKLKIRPLAIVEANGALHFSSGRYVFKRIDGPNPKYVTVHDLSDFYSGDIHSAVGGIRGMTTVDNPEGSGHSLVFVWSPRGGLFKGDIFRLDPDTPKANHYTRHKEVVLGDILSKYLKTPVYFILGAYNDFLPVPYGNTVEHIIGFETVIRKGRHPVFISNSNPHGGSAYYRGGAFAIRSPEGKYRIAEIEGKGGIKQSDPPLAATVGYAVSPFKNELAVYFSGLDPNHVDATNHAWIYKGLVKTDRPYRARNSSRYASTRTSSSRTPRKSATPSVRLPNERFRTWRSSKGTSLEAKALSMTSSSVVLKKRSGRSIRIKRSALAAADQLYLTSRE